MFDGHGLCILQLVLHILRLLHVSSAFPKALKLLIFTFGSTWIMSSTSLCPCHHRSSCYYTSRIARERRKTLPHLEYLSFLECLALLVQLQLLKAELWHKPPPVHHQRPLPPPTSICLKPFNPLISLTINSNSLDLCLWLSFPLLPIIPPFLHFPLHSSYPSQKKRAKVSERYTDCLVAALWQHNGLWFCPALLGPQCTRGLGCVCVCVCVCGKGFYSLQP